MKEELLKSRKQVRIYFDSGQSEMLSQMVKSTELPETTLCTAIVIAGLAALIKQGGYLTIPLRFKVEDPKKL